MKKTDAAEPAPAPALAADVDEGSKIRMLLDIFSQNRLVGDLSSVRFSLPTQLIHPIPNLEYWTYLDQPDTFASIGDSEFPLGRMLETLRFWFTKDLKHIKGKPIKPYNSTLGEFFRCNWDAIQMDPIATFAAGASAKSEDRKKPVKVSFLTEQTSHHPPVSAFYIDCPAKGVYARGYDHINTRLQLLPVNIKVLAGQHNMGIFITLANRDDEQYRLTHPPAKLGGFMTGSLSVSVTDSCFVTCPKTKIKTILEYAEEGWVYSKPVVRGVIFTYDPDNDTRHRIKDVPESDVLARIEGCWMKEIYFSLATDPKTKHLLINLEPLLPVEKNVPPESVQLENESRRFWSSVTEAIRSRNYPHANTLKMEIEGRQRTKATEREEAKIEWAPRFFQGALTPVGMPELTDEGKLVLDGLHRDQFELKPAKDVAAVASADPESESAPPSQT